MITLGRIIVPACSWAPATRSAWWARPWCLLPAGAGRRVPGHADARGDGGVAPRRGLFMEYARVGLGDWPGYFVGWLYWYFWVGVIASRPWWAGRCRGAGSRPCPRGGLRDPAADLHRHQPDLRALFGRWKLLVASVKVAVIVAFLVVGTLFASGSGRARTSDPQPVAAPAALHRQGGGPAIRAWPW
ncbi:hypothetical protein QJS66_10310 [Kocuria rhizophila]|nr:hypothetical protein QJS66_10310 [Kocuria rhizophila]